MAAAAVVATEAMAAAQERVDRAEESARDAAVTSARRVAEVEELRAVYGHQAEEQALQGLVRRLGAHQGHAFAEFGRGAHAEHHRHLATFRAPSHALVGCRAHVVRWLST